ncbi:MAG: response regulator transcription factor [Flavobacteriaceae bacterium]
MESQSILLVEDNFLNRRISKKVLVENGYLVYEAKNTKETHEILKNETISLIILDINLGEDEQDGITLGQQIKEKYGVPFIYLTAYENAEIISKAVATSPYSYLTKPFKNVDLITSVEIALRQSANRVKNNLNIMVKDEDYNVSLPADQINYIESDGNYLLFHTDKKVYKCRSTIKQILEKLPETDFLQVHRAYVVNKNKIEKYCSKSVVIKNREVPVSKNFKI